MTKKIVSLYQVKVTTATTSYVISFDNRAAAFDFKWDAQKHPKVKDVHLMNDHGYVLYSTAANAVASLEWLK